MSLLPGKNNTSRRILINVSAGIGDALMAEPMVRALHQYEPGIRIDILATPLTGQIFEGHPAVTGLQWLSTRGIQFLGLIAKLHREKYDLFIGSIPSNTYSQIAAPVLGGIPLRIKHRTPHRGRRDLDFLFQEIVELRTDRHRVDCNCDLLRGLGIEVAEAKRAPRFSVSPGSVDSAILKLQAKGWEAARKTVGFHPGCNPKAAFKRWDPRRFAALSDFLIETFDVQVLIVGSRDEEEDVRILSESVRNPVINLAGQCSLAETAAAIKQCHFFVSNDSGIMHLAAAVEVPTFALFGPKDDRHVGPYGNKHTVIRNGNDVNTITIEQVTGILQESPSGLKTLPKK